MILTEEEARKKWCPFATVPDTFHCEGVVTVPVTRPVQSAEPHCMASDCMAWRPNGRALDVNGVLVGGAREPKDRRLGYCGLAGEPEPGNPRGSALPVWTPWGGPPQERRLPISAYQKQQPKETA